ncbi:DMT family transporter [Streptomyces tateyamensis]|uniref:DMT family transporter n=1 Tax=Streptomyces tateyamensis TaxID=565073 RepID=UPI0015E8CB8C|nr:DMT family transporter [Streptomyces tateyamensis]
MAYLCYFRGLRLVSPSTATVVMFTVPVFGVTCSVVLLGESFTALQAVGAAVMLVGALLAVTQGRLPARSATARPVRAPEGGPSTGRRTRSSARP